MAAGRQAVRWTRRAAMILVTVAVAAGCGGGGGAPKAEAPKPATPAPAPAAQSPTAAAPAQPAKALGTVKVALINCSDVCGWQLAANDKGYFKAAGVNVEYQFIGGSSPMLKALISGDVDVAEIAPPEVFISREQGAKIKLVGASVPGTAFSILAKSAIKTVADLEGKVVGTSQVGASPYQMVLGLMNKTGRDPKKVQWVNAGDNAGRMQALLAGRVDAVPVPTSFESQIKGKDQFRVLARVGEQLPEYLRVGIAVRDDLVQQKDALLKAYFTAYSKGFREAAKDKELFVTVSMAATKLGSPSRETFDEAWQTSVQQKLVSPDFSVAPASLLYVQDMNLQVGSQQKKLDITELYDDRFVKAVQAELGAWKW